MTIKNYKIIPLLFLALFVSLFVLTPRVASAHQPRIVDGLTTQVPDPEISKAYYAELSGKPQTYVIQSDKAFDLYVSLTVPDIEGQRTDFAYYIYQDGNKIYPLVEFNGSQMQWSKFWEKFGHDSYLQAGEFQKQVPAGTYEIEVLNIDNQGKYVLAVGETEMFDFKEGLNAIKTIPVLKKNFFNKSPIDFILSPFGWGLIVIMYILAFIVGFIYRAILKKFARQSAHGAPKNIGKSDRLLRAVIGVGLLLWAITTTWSPILIFFSGFALFEAIFSWCGFYAAMGKNTCPVE